MDLQLFEREIAISFAAAVGTPAELAALETKLVAVEKAVDRSFRSGDES